jgi:excisionase family DNA binding protein
MLTTGEIAEHCGVNFRTVIRWIKAGHLNAFQLPGRGDNRVTLPDFLGFLKQHNMPVPAEFEEHQRRVLIVDDDVNLTNAMQRVLRRAGFETAVAHDGFQAGAQAETYSPNAITLDLQMPGIDGMGVIGFLRGSESLKDVKILVVSAMPRQRLDEALGAGADDVLAKPFENSDLLDRLYRLTGLQPQAA